jgi:phosphatidylinositol kinase/protein kinase (PI-3  family)
MLNSHHLYEKIGAILAITELIDCTSASAESKVARLAKALSNSLSLANDFDLIDLIGEALGHMARSSPVQHVEYLESELNRSLDWLRGKPSSHKRFAACTILQQLAKNAPTVFFARINEFFDLIWGPIWDSKEVIRLVASRALSSCLAVLKERTYHLQWYCFIYDQLQEGFHNTGEEFVHGSLLVVTEVLKYTGDFMIPRFKEVCKAIMSLKDHRSRLVRLAIIGILPSLAKLCPDAFARAHMDETIDFLLKSMKSSELRSSALLSTGKLCLVIGSHLINRIDEITNVLKEVFSSSSTSSRRSSKLSASDSVAEALLCVSDMVQGLGGPFHVYVYNLVEPMLQSGLTAELIETLSVVCNYLPSQKQLVQSRLLEEATKVLGGDWQPNLVEPAYGYSWGRKGERINLTKSFSGNNPNNPNEAAGGRESGGLVQPVPSWGSLTPSQSFSQLNGRNRLGSFRQSGGGRHTTISPAPPVATPQIAPPQKTPKTKSKGGFFSTFTKSSSRSETSAKNQPATTLGVGVAAIGQGLGLGTEHDHYHASHTLHHHEIVLLSLKTLASLSIPLMNLIHIVQYSVLPYLHSDDYCIRKEAAITCAKMISTIVSPRFSKGPTAIALEDIISRLLEVSVSDTSTQVRLGVLKALTKEFDHYLARSHNIEALMMLLADELFDIKLEALSLLGRLAITNPATVLPAIRIHLTRLIAEMTSNAENKLIEESVTMLCNFMKFPKFHFLVKPVMSTLLNSLPLYKIDVRTTTAALETVGELSLVLHYDLLPYADTLLPVVITNMFDLSSIRKQEVAVRTLGQYVKSTGLVVRPYLQYPQLLPKMLDLLCHNSANKPYSLRMEILRTLGLLGALEPQRYAAISSYVSAMAKNKKLTNENTEESTAKDKKSGNLHTNNPNQAGSLLPFPASSVDTRSNMAHKEKERDRSESNLSFPEKSAQLKHEKEEIDRRGNATIDHEDIVRTDKLLHGDAADAPAHTFMYELAVMRSLPDPVQEKVISTKHTPGSEDFYPRVSLTSLVKILQDSTLSIHHSTSTQTIIQIFCGLGVRCVPFLEQIVPYFLQIVRKSGVGLRESILQQLSQLVAIAGHYITPYLPGILEILKDYWSEHLEYVLGIVQQIAITTTEAFAEYLPTLLPLLLLSLTLPREISSEGLKGNPNLLKPLEEMLNCLRVLRISLRSHIHLFIPKLCKLLTVLQDEIGLEATLSTQTMVIQTFKHLINGSKGAVLEQCNEIVSVLVHSLCRTMIKCYSRNIPPNTDIFTECIITLTILAQQIGKRILTFDSLILRSTEGRGIDNFPYKEVSAAVRNGSWDEMIYADREELLNPIDFNSFDNLSTQESNLVGIGNSPGGLLNSPAMGPYNGISKLALNQQQLARAWDVSQRSTPSDWHDWLWRLNVELLRESPTHTLRVCAPLAQAYPPMAKELFHAAFVSCWHELSEQYQDSLIRALQIALRSAPSEILQSLLNLAEFMEHDVEALPINLSILAELAQKGHAYAKALHYRELEFQTNAAGCFENLININKKLDQYEAAVGLLNVAKQIQKKFPELKEFYTVQESWLAKLGYWDEALSKYDEKIQSNSKDSLAIAGKVKCLEALGKWEEAVKLCEENLLNMKIDSETSHSNTHTKAAVIGARAAWSLNEWNLMDDFVCQLPADNVDGSFMKAILAVHRENYDDAHKNIETTRTYLDKSISALMTESYGRAYMPLIMVQQCSELEEIMEYKIFLKDSGLISLLNESSSQIGLNNDIEILKSLIDPHNGNIYDSSHMDAMILSNSFYHLEDHHGLPRRPNRHETISDQLAYDSPSTTASETNSSANNETSSNQKYLLEEAKARKQMISEKWRRRIRGCSATGRNAIPYWKFLLNGRKMILNEKEDLDTWLDFVTLCRNNGNPSLAERVISLSSQQIMSSAQSHHHQKFGNMASATRTFVNVMEGRSSPLSPSIINNLSNSAADEEAMIMERRIRFAMLKQQWDKGDHMNALLGLDHLVRNTRLSTSNHSSASPVPSPTGFASSSSSSLVDSSYLSCLLKLGEWKISILDPSQNVDLQTRMDVLQIYSHATMIDPNSYRASHQWGLCNYRAIEELRNSHKSFVNSITTSSTPSHYYHQQRAALSATTQIGGSPNVITREQFIGFAVNAIKGLMKALTLGTRMFSSSVMQDMLCILSLWFRYGKLAEVYNALESGLATVAIDTWLGVLPQLIARIDHPDKDARHLLHSLLMRLGSKHAQALVYPLSVALKSQKDDRKEIAESLMNGLKQNNPKLIEQALLVSQELIRVAISWEESWHWGLEDASRQCFGEGNIQAMIATLEPLHELMNKGATTVRESSFIDTYKYELGRAWDCIQAYKQAMNEKNLPIPTKKPQFSPIGGAQAPLSQPEESHITQAWDFYYPVFKRINSQLPHINALDLTTCAPQLHAAVNLDIGVPGTYQVNGNAVRIKNFLQTIAIIRSKQRPRKLRIVGEDGQEFVFLLKGHEDLRQDERAMQLFGLVNALLYHDRTAGVSSEDYQIQRYAVMPLSTHVGLIGWVPNCDTLHDLIRAYRDSRKIMLDVEHRLILQVAPGKLYDSLPMMHKLEVFEHAMTYTAGEDLAKILWLKSENSESWLQRRATYTRSLAVMSMVGYILGLGDRHPSNLMLDRKTGKIIHIDFGDCFEVAKHRDKFPERVPFRLTRMLVNAMEVAGIEGNYRITCEKVMSVLRENRDSLVATLEAFVHDPLISWRLMNINP